MRRPKYKVYAQRGDRIRSHLCCCLFCVLPALLAIAVRPYSLHLYTDFIAICRPLTLYKDLDIGADHSDGTRSRLYRAPISD